MKNYWMKRSEMHKPQMKNFTKLEIIITQQKGIFWKLRRGITEDMLKASIRYLQLLGSNMS